MLRSTALVLALSGCVDADGRLVNTIPMVGIESPDADDDVLFEGVAATFRGYALDNEDPSEDLVASWWVGQEVVCADAAPNSDGETQCDITLPGGNNEVRLQVTDRGGLIARTVDAFWTRPNSAPTADITSLPSTAPYFAEEPIAFEGFVGDVEDASDQLVIWWESSVDGPLQDIDLTVHPHGRATGVGLLTEGEHDIRLYVEDRAGDVSFDAAVVRVGPARRAATER